MFLNGWLYVRHFKWHTKRWVKSSLGQIKTPVSLQNFLKAWTPGYQHLRRLGCLLRTQVSTSYPTLSESSSRPGNLNFNKHPPTHSLGSVGLCSESCALPSMHTHSSPKRKGHVCPSCKTEYTFISHTVQSSTGRKALCIAFMINILFYLVCHWKPSTSFV